MGTSTLKTSVTVCEPNRFSALIVTRQLETDSEGAPQMKPDIGFNIRPTGKYPEMRVYVTGSPMTDGVSEKDSSFSIE